MASYLDFLARTPYNRAGALRQSDTLSKFMTAAGYLFQRIFPAPFSVFCSQGGKPVMHPKLARRLEYYRKWDIKKEKREAYTSDMFITFHTQVAERERREPMKAFLDLHSLVFDTQTLGVFTGSRVSDYAQSSGPRDTVSRVPARHGEASSRLPIAFVKGDFEFLAPNGHTLKHKDVFDNPNLASQLNITFRYDKSGRNFTVRKFGRGDAFLCPIRAARRLLLRADMLEIPDKDPICAYRPAGRSGHLWLLAREVTATMRRICFDTYPDPEHYLQQHINNIASHSNRVTAAVALSQSGMSIDEIAHRLRWKPESVAFYLRESARDIGFYTKNVIAGAQREFVASH